MAVSQTFPTRAASRRLGFQPLDVLVVAAVLLLLYGAVRVGRGAAVSFIPSQTTSIDTSAVNLPYYAARSLLRMFVALFFSVTFSLGYAYVAARSRRARRVLLPALDILQSVPVLGFLTVTVTFFIGLFPGSLLGLEAASVFAVFTAQVWNMTFSFYQSMMTLPRELDEASRLMGLSRWTRFWTIEVPNGMIGLVWNGMMSFGGSWFFLTASEQISLFNSSYTLPGVGSYVGAASAKGELGHVMLAIVTMILVVLAVNVLFWRPLVAYSERFRVEESEATEKPRSLVLDVLRRTQWPAALGRGVRLATHPVGRALGTLTGVDDQPLVTHPTRRRLGDVNLHGARRRGRRLRRVQPVGVRRQRPGSRGVRDDLRAGRRHLPARRRPHRRRDGHLGACRRVDRLQPARRPVHAAGYPGAGQLSRELPLSVRGTALHRSRYQPELRRDPAHGAGSPVVHPLQRHRRRQRGAERSARGDGQPRRPRLGAVEEADPSGYLLRLRDRRNHRRRRSLERDHRRRGRHLQRSYVVGHRTGRLHRPGYVGGAAHRGDHHHERVRRRLSPARLPTTRAATW